MRNWVKQIVVVILLGAANAANAGVTAKEISGKWVKAGANSVECLCGECIDIQPEGKPQPFCVESNQVYITVFYQLNAKLNQVDVVFGDVIEVGVGGASLPWNRFDKHKPLAVVDVSDVKHGKIKVKWYGFRLKNNKSYAWVGDSYSGTYTRTTERDPHR
ncbi:hypothetical protein [Geomonas propionica]|uniref:Lipoprotein n=1 Tax=Geomonas propionica TaxID=2798582 RepID=A0ABS0YKT2_9BACT|nr:hypothetical protein [Geomonas propionica]MBJ6798553.1 hypothetical protein [Geomonas propionica]